MGMCICTWCCPIGLVTGGVTSSVVERATAQADVLYVLPWIVSFVAGLVMYLALTIRCTPPSQPWLPWWPAERGSGCWDGDTASELGAMAGFCLGMGFVGVIVTLVSFRNRRESRRSMLIRISVRRRLATFRTSVALRRGPANAAAAPAAADKAEYGVERA